MPRVGDGKYKVWFNAMVTNACPEKTTIGTLRTHAYSIRWLAERMDGFDAEEQQVPKPEQVLDYLDEAKISEGRRASVLCAMKVWHRCRGEKELCGQYGPALIRTRHLIKTQHNLQERSPAQQKNWVPYKCFKKYAAKLRQEIFALPKDKILTKDQYVQTTLAFILTFHLKYPVRNELRTVTWSNTEENHITDKTLVLKKHKCAKSMGTITFALTRPMQRLLRIIKTAQRHYGIEKDYVILSKHWKPMTTGGFSSYLRRELKRIPECKDKNVTAMLLRHICITHKRHGQMTIAQEREFCRSCLHSVPRNNLYRIEKKRSSDLSSEKVTDPQ